MVSGACNAKHRESKPPSASYSSLTAAALSGRRSECTVPWSDRSPSPVILIEGHGSSTCNLTSKIGKSSCYGANLILCAISSPPSLVLDEECVTQRAASTGGPEDQIRPGHSFGEEKEITEVVKTLPTTSKEKRITREFREACSPVSWLIGHW
eukprot:795283-Pelagomonas_calceolata.AAC.1